MHYYNKRYTGYSEVQFTYTFSVHRFDTSHGLRTLISTTEVTRTDTAIFTDDPDENDAELNSFSLFGGGYPVEAIAALEAEMQRKWPDGFAQYLRRGRKGFFPWRRRRDERCENLAPPVSRNTRASH